MTAHAFIAGVEGLRIDPAERRFLRDADPWGLILFARNIKTPDQVRALTADFRDAVGRADAPVLIDQEGGRVQRLSPPQWPKYPPAAALGRLYRENSPAGVDATRLAAQLIAADLTALGITVDCAPVADLPIPGAHGIIGDRAYSDTVSEVSVLARAFADGLRSGGVAPVLKHIPGHGRANADSHHAFPVVAADRATLEATDFAVFRALAGLPMAMTAHVEFTDIDPVAPATTSATTIRDVIRGSIGFDGLLMTDDVSMEALAGSLRERAAAAVAAGCDIVLHCNGKLAEMRAVAEAVPALSGEAERRAYLATGSLRPSATLDPVAAHRQLAMLMQGDARAAT
jgi:beta-N-acetylhexosaminidase